MNTDFCYLNVQLFGAPMDERPAPSLAPAVAAPEPGHGPVPLPQEPQGPAEADAPVLAPVAPPRNGEVMHVDSDPRDVLAPDQVFAALADRTRRKILRRLLDGPQRVGGLATALGLPMPSASRHLKALMAAGLVVRERSGSRAYSLAEPTSGFHAAIIHSIVHAGEETAVLRAVIHPLGL